MWQLVYTELYLQKRCGQILKEHFFGLKTIKMRTKIWKNIEQIVNEWFSLIIICLYVSLIKALPKLILDYTTPREYTAAITVDGGSF